MTATTVRFHLDGMTCGSCVARAERVLAALPGVTRAAVNLGTQSATVEFAAPATREVMAVALGKAGYPVAREHVTLAVEGMTCAACTGRVERVLRSLPGVAGAVANLATRRVDVELWERVDPVRLAAVVAKAGYPAHPLAGEALTRLHAMFKGDELVLDKWFALQAGASDRDGHVLPLVQQLMSHPDFHLKNPNRARSLLFAYCNGNPGAFHRADGAGYQFWCLRVLEIDAFNPQLAARLARALDRWSRLAEPYRAAAREAIAKVAAKPDLSNDVREVVSRALAD